jgi:hypothetical protein
LRWEDSVRLSGIALASALFLPALTCVAQENGSTSLPDASANKPGWAYSATGMYYSLPDQSDFLLAVAIAERGPLHLEARYNYEALDAGSLFAGWKFSGGEALTYDLTPIIGAVFGSAQGIAPGFEASVAYGIADFYTEAEHVYDTNAKEDSFTYAWSELGLSPLDWLRFGLVGQRTRVINSDRDIQQGGFAQFITPGKVTLGLYVFNPGDSANRFAIFSLAAKF